MVTYQEGDEILRLLNSLVQEPVPDRPDEIILVHNGGNNLTLSLLKAFQITSPVPMKIFINSANHLGRARRLAVDHSSCQLIAFTDGDCEIPEGWLKEMTHHFQQLQEIIPKLAGVAAPNRLPETSSMGIGINLMLSSPLGHGNSPQASSHLQPQSVDHLPTTNAIFHRDSLIQVGNFSQQLVSCCEDVEIGLRLINSGFHLYLMSSPVVINHCAHSWRDWCQRLFRFGYYQARWISPLRTQLHRPSFLSCMGLFLAALSLFMVMLYPWLLAIFIIYLVFVTFETCRTLRKSQPLKSKMAIFFSLTTSFILTHFSYGMGSSVGYIKRISNKFSRKNSNVCSTHKSEPLIPTHQDQ